MFEKFLRPFLSLPHFRGKTRIEQMLRRALWMPRRVEVIHGLRMELDPSEWAQLKLLKRQWIEPKTIERYATILRPGDTFIDVGAHVGFHSLIARHFVGTNGQVIAVEPQPYNANKILANWRANGFTNLHLYVAAAGAEPGMVELHDQVFHDRSMLTLLDSGGKDQAQTFEVPLVRLDSILAKRGLASVRLLKIDVEGYELEVVKGLGSRLEAVENLIFEYVDGTNRKQMNAQLVSFLRDTGFRLATIDGSDWQAGTAAVENNLWALRG